MCSPIWKHTISNRFRVEKTSRKGGYTERGWWVHKMSVLSAFCMLEIIQVRKGVSWRERGVLGDLCLLLSVSTLNTEKHMLS